MASNDLAKQTVRREAVRSRIKTSLDNIKNELQNPVVNEEQLADDLAQISTREKKITALNQVIFDLIKDDDDLKNELADVEDWVDEITLWKDRAKRYMDKMQRNASSAASVTSGQGGPPSSQSSNTTHSTSKKNVKLPQIQIKKYNGDSNQWQRFWGQFRGTIDQDPELSDTDKLIYLRSFLEGEAEEAIRTVIDGEGSYALAIHTLEKRFGRRSMLISTRMNNILQLPPVSKSNDIKGLRHLHDTCQIEVRSLEALGILSASDGELMAHILGGLLPIELLERFGDDPLGQADVWKIDDLLSFLGKAIEGKERAISIHRAGSQHKTSSTVQVEKPHSKPVPSYSGRSSSAAALNTAVSPVPSSRFGTCVFCEGPHPYYTCTKLTVSERKEIALRKQVCFLCMRSGHVADNCRGKIQKCRKCRRKHHQILCDDEKNKNQDNPSDINVNTAAQSEQVQTKEIMLQTVRAVIRGDNGHERGVRCLFDGGSHRCFINEKLSRELGLEKVGEEKLNVFKFESNVPTTMVRNRVKVVLKNARSEETVTIEALGTPGISGGVFTVPSGDIASEMEKRGYTLSDSESEASSGAEAPLDMLIGADYFWAVAKGPVERLSDRLVVIDTKLGWTLHGTTKVAGAALSVAVNAINVMRVTVKPESEDDLLSERVKAFWDLEHLGINDTPEASDFSAENKVIKDFQKSIQFNNGRYQVSFPWKDNVNNLGDNYEVAKKRTLSLLERLRKDPVTFRAYDAIIQEQIKTGIVEQVPENHVIEGPLYYLPHRGVVRVESVTTKLRIVNDGSSHAKNVPSLNDCIESGPNLLPELFNILVRFRENKIAVTGDIEKAFHQIGIVERDRDSLRFLWVKGLESPDNQTLVELRLTRVPFGVTASPFLLAATIKVHAQKYLAEYPIASEALLRDLYVDDLAAGGKGVTEADNLIKETKAIMASAGMNLRKWHSNSPEIRAKWGNESLGLAGTHPLPNPGLVKVLGLTWDEVGDCLMFDVEPLLTFLLNRLNTKRWVLKAVARIFDPLGFITPFTISAKMLLQELWENKINWDAELGLEFSEKFNSWCTELRNLIKIKVPRFYFQNCSDEPPISIELHGFVDASVIAYASVFYLKNVYANGLVSTVLVASKAKVAPLKKELKSQCLKVPRLELMAAVIGARLANSLVETLTVKLDKIQMWTDSTIALCWIRGEANRWKPFVQNRVREIQAHTDPKSWNHVAGTENPADLPTRGKSLKDIASCDLWWHGPQWLQEENCPIENFVQTETVPKEATCELRASTREFMVNINSVAKSRETVFDIKKYSSLQLVVRLTAWILRFVNNIRAKDDKTKGALNTKELEAAERYWIRNAQSESYPDEIINLEKGEDVPKQSPIRSLDPKLDDLGLLCVGGRLGAAKMSYREKHPWLLSPSHPIAYLIGYSNHIRLKHAGLNDVLVETREQFWIPRGRQLIKKIITSCPRCKIFRAKPTTAVMAPLPDVRINPSPPFEICGIDHAGPIYVKPNKKCYIALYTCAVTRAVHLELVTDLTTESFLMSFRRFIARRGIVRVIYSDNAATFKRADEDLKILLNNIRSPKVTEFLGGLKISWKYIAERGAWWGGFWERMVKSVKTSLRKVLGQALLTYEEIETLLVEIEATINSRPITFVYDSPGEPQPLTPSHFLVGKRLTVLPSQVYSTSELPPAGKRELVKRLKYRQALLDRFWVRWKDNYLLELRSAHHLKLNKGQPTKELQTGDVVLIEDTKSPRCMWKLAVVQELTKGRDGIVRSCLVRLSNGNKLRRPVQLLYNLEL